MSNRPAAVAADTEAVARLRLAVMRLARRLRQQADPGVTPSMLSAMASIEYRGPITLGELAEAERVQPPTMTKIVGRLLDAGLIDRVPDPDDRRVTRVTLSAEGRRFIHRARTAKNAYLAKRIARLDPADVVALMRATDAIERLLEDEE